MDIDTDKNIINIIQLILQVVKPEKIILFGSRARGDAKLASDYDILVIASSIDNPLKVEQDIYEKLITIKEKVDLLVRTPEKVEMDKNRQNSFLKNALLEGLVVYGK